MEAIIGTQRRVLENLRENQSKITNSAAHMKGCRTRVYIVFYGGDEDEFADNYKTKDREIPRQIKEN